MKQAKSLFSMLLIVCFFSVTMVETAMATLISTEEVARTAAVERGDSPHEKLNEMFARAEVQAKLEKLGVNAADAEERIAALTDEEAATYVSQIESAPAGGIIGAILVVFFVLLLTDILGLTKVFPFTRSLR
ncbi:MAG TPA: PA2779 family protein [Azoarcus sp.]|nr:PA2779 family protein [Azoarcus sp.]